VKTRSDPRARTGARRWNAPPVFVERITLRGAVREPRVYAVARLAFAQSRETRCEHNAWEVPPSVAVHARQMRCAESSREGASHRRKTARTFARVGPVPHHASSEARMRGSSARAVPARGRTKAKAHGGSSPPDAARGNDAARGGCPCIVVLQKSAVRPRAQRSVKPGSVGSKARAINGAREREPDRRRRQARERRGSSAAKGGRFTSARRSSSRERRVSGEGNVVSSALRRGRDVRRD